MNLKLGTAICALCMLSSLAFAQQKPDYSTPEATVRTFMNAFSNADFVAAGACVENPIGAKTLEETAPKGQKITIAIDKLTVTASGDTATVSITIKVPQVLSDELKVKRVGAEWKLYSDTNADVNAFNSHPLQGLVYAMSHPQVFVDARNRAKQASCLSNLKQICLGMMMFIQDNEEAFKIKPLTYKASIMPYIKNDKIFVCPSSPGTNPSYSFNANLAGLKASKLSSPATTVLIYEGRTGKLNFIHDGSACVGFADGHCKMVNAEGAKSLRWAP